MENKVKMPLSNFESTRKRELRIEIKSENDIEKTKIVGMAFQRIQSQPEKPALEILAETVAEYAGNNAKIAALTGMGLGNIAKILENYPEGQTPDLFISSRLDNPEELREKTRALLTELEKKLGKNKVEPIFIIENRTHEMLEGTITEGRRPILNWIRKAEDQNREPAEGNAAESAPEST